MSAAENVSSSYQWRSFKTAELGKVSPWVEKLGRAGYFAKGTLYLLVGLSALALPFGMGGDTDGTSDALRKIGQQPFGRVLLGVMALSLIGYFIWRMVMAIQDTEAAGTDAKGCVKRTGYGISGLVYLGLAFLAGKIAVTGVDSGGDSSKEQAKETMLSTTWGQYLYIAIGVVVIGTALYFVYKGVTAKFMSKYNLAQMSEKVRSAALHLGRTGLITRGIAFGIIGWFVVRTGLNGGSGGEVAGMGDALDWLGSQPFGPWLVGTVGFGLACFGVHTMLMGWYRRFNVEA